MTTEKVTVIGAGLAGSEAAWQLAERGIQVTLYEMRPQASSPAHHTEQFAELVCSNSLRAANIENAVGLLKEEMRRMNSLIMTCADATAVPAGGALAVDRHKFSAMVTATLEAHPNVTVVREEVTSIPDEGIVIIATGPLTAPVLGEKIKALTGSNDFYFYDAAAPIVTAESLNYDKVFAASRYDKGDADYLNCPMTKEEYEAFWQALTTAEAVQPKEFEKEIYFEGCMPVEIMAARGWSYASQYVHQLPGITESCLPAQKGTASFLCRTNDRCRRLFGIGGLRFDGRLTGYALRTGRSAH